MWAIHIYPLGRDIVVFILTDNTNPKANVQNQTTNNPNPNPNTEHMEEEHDRNSKILARLGALKRLSSIFRGGDHIRRSLGGPLDNIANTISNAQGELYNISSYMDSQRKYYSTGMSYKDVNKLKITKDQLYSLFCDPSTGLVPPTSQPHISVGRCIEPNIKSNWMDRWYMVFDEGPHGNRDIPFYFLRKLYDEFILGKHVN